MEDSRLGANARITVDLGRQVVVRPNGEEIGFSVDPFRRHMLLHGLDEIGQTMQRTAAIDSYESARKSAKPWMPSISA